jgi:hypothetical protein
MANVTLRLGLINSQFYLLELLFAVVVVTTILEAPRLGVRRRVLLAGLLLGAFAWLLTSTVAPRTSRIYYDEQIYQGVAHNLSDLHLAQMCNDGSMEYGRLQCRRGEYNKEPNGYPYLRSIVYRAFGVSDGAAFRFNNVVAGVTVLVTVLLADLLFGHAWMAILSGLILTVLPMQLTWSATAAAEPTAAMWCAGAALAAVHFVRVRTTGALAWTIVVTAFATTIRPECILIVPLVVAAIALFAPAEFRRPRIWIGAAAGALAATPTILHMIAVWHEGWGTSGPTMSAQFAARNFPVNFWFYFADERFPAVCGVALALGLMFTGRVLERLWLLAYFLAFWTVFLFFYAGSYNYGADVRYSLMTDVPAALLGGYGLGRIGDFIMRRWPGYWRERRVFGSIAAVVAAQFLWYLPLVRATGEEAWAARSDVKYARAFAAALPPNSFVLTHNPNMFHLWKTSAGQMSMVTTDRAAADQLFNRYTGGVYLHWNFWCNVHDQVQRGFCRAALDIFPHEALDSRRERDYEYVLYRLQPRTPGHDAVMTKVP